MKHGKERPKGEGAELIALLGLVFVVLFALIWFLASHRIVYSSASWLQWMAWPYVLWDPEQVQALGEAAQAYRQRPRDIGFVYWLRFVNACLLPACILVSLALLGYAALRLVGGPLGGRGREWKRRLDPMAAAREIAHVFPNILPVLHLGPDLIADRLPLWRRQTFPEEIWFKELVDGRPLAAHGRLDKHALQTFLRGGESLDGPHQTRGGRRWSKTLGFQVVDLLKDAGKQQEICFPDRFSAQGKVLFALLAAYAFGGKEGKPDYEKACAQLSRTCAGQPNGLPNLTVAQWIYTKYRMNAQARQLFAVHHWEYTYLYALFALAKKNGKATHTDWIWLKPVDRILWYVLNTLGRGAPHAESAAAFVMVDYERQCSKAKRLPLRVRSDGQMEHHIHVLPALEAHEREFERWHAAQDDDEDWWRQSHAWSGARALQQQAREIESITQEMRKVQDQLAGVPVPEDTSFDVEMRQKWQAKEAQSARQRAELLDELFAGDPAAGKSGAKSGAIT